MLFVYLPVAFKDDFAPFISSILPCILKVEPVGVILDYIILYIDYLHNCITITSS